MTNKDMPAHQPVAASGEEAIKIAMQTGTCLYRLLPTPEEISAALRAALAEFEGRDG